MKNEETVNDKKENQKGFNNLWIVGGVSVILIILLWFLNYYIAKPLPQRGTLGDMFGAVNALFSGLAFAGIIIALFFQRIDLKNQFKEIQQTRKEFQKQNETLELQKFENRFFNLLSIHHQIVSDIDGSNDLLSETKDKKLWHYLTEKEHKKYKEPIAEITDKKNINTSRDVFKYWLDLLHNLIKDNLLFMDKEDLGSYEDKLTKNKYSLMFNQIDFFEKSIVSFNGVSIDSKFESIYSHIYRKLNTDFGHYFRNLYRMVKLVDETTFNKKDEIKNIEKKYEYTSIIRAQLSDYETEWLFFNCLSNLGRDKFKPLTEKYSLLKMIDLKDKVYLHYKELYEQTAFRKHTEKELNKRFENEKASLQQLI